MCGIAGFNCSEEFAHDILTEGVMNNVLQESWLWNLHRGMDSAGYFAKPVDNDKIKVFKRQGDAATTLVDLHSSKKGVKIPVTNVFGAHTRAATKGVASRNENNHPVYYNGIWVTHNGVINNDDELRRDVPEAKRDQLPAVDTVAINIALSNVENPYDVKDIASNLEDLTGSFAIHAIWRDYPGMSLLAKGPGSPLIIALNKEMLVYGSEPESVWHMIERMGFEEPHTSWTWREMEAGAVMLVQEGSPFAWAEIPKKTWGNTNRSNIIRERLLPAEDDREVQTVYSARLTNDFALKNGGTARSMTYVEDADDLLLVYTRKEGFTGPEDKKEFPMHSDSTTFSVLSEADAVYKNKASGFLHALYGDIEIVMNNSRTIQDIYNTKLFADAARWQSYENATEQTQKAQAVSDLNYEGFMNRLSSAVAINRLPHEREEYRYLVRHGGPKKAGRRISIQDLISGKQAQNGENIFQLPLPRDTTRTEEGTKSSTKKTSTGKDTYKWEPQQEITWEDIFDDDSPVTIHDKEELMFSHNLRCHQHGEMFGKHNHPFNCNTVMAAATYALSCIKEITLHNFLFDGTRLTLNKTDKFCGMGSNDVPQCSFENTVYKRVQQQNIEVDILTGETCKKCGTVRRLILWPEWVKERMTDFEYEVVNAN